MSENITQKRERALKIIKLLRSVYPDSSCTLDYSEPFQLLIATQLAAQCTDARVNTVTPALFGRYPTVFALAEADPDELSSVIRSTGFFRNKTKNIIACCQKLVSDFGGEIPRSMDELLSLAGVGRKTANLILGDCFGIAGIVVDTHAGRLSRRMGLTKSTDPKRVELDLLKIIPPDEQTAFCHRLVDHGREFCKAQRPRCAECPLKELCPQIL